MILFKKANDLRKWVEIQVKSGYSIGFVPTMGALHGGHVSLINTSVSENNFTIASIFVNPTQFNDPADFAKYPVTIERDIVMLEKAGCNVIFLPEVKEMYPDGTGASRHYELGYLETIFEGKYRPGHFQGVCNIVDRLLAIVKPHILYLGQKDYQQCMVLRRLVNDYHPGTTTRICPTLREEDGLAMSSRNARLDVEARAKAPVIYETLSWLKESLEPGAITSLTESAKHKLEKAGLRPDYFAIAEANTLNEINEWDGKTNVVAVVAAFLDDVRLIDNFLLN